MFVVATYTSNTIRSVEKCHFQPLVLNSARLAENISFCRKSRPRPQNRKKQEISSTATAAAIAVPIVGHRAYLKLIRMKLYSERRPESSKQVWEPPNFDFPSYRVLHRVPFAGIKMRIISNIIEEGNALLFPSEYFSNLHSTVIRLRVSLIVGLCLSVSQSVSQSVNYSILYTCLDEHKLFVKYSYFTKTAITFSTLAFMKYFTNTRSACFSPK